MPTPTPTPGVVAVSRAFQRERAQLDSNGLLDVQCWQVETSDPTFTSLQAIFAVDPNGNFVPGPNSQHQIAAFDYLYAQQYTPERVNGNPFHHLVWVTYSPYRPQFSGTETGKWNVDIEIDGVENRESIFKDLDNLTIGNSAGYPYDGGVEETFYDEQITVSFNTTVVDQDNISSCRGRVNTSAVTLTIGNSLPGFGSSGTGGASPNTYQRTYEPYTLRLLKARQKTQIVQLSAGTPANYFGMKYDFVYRKPQFSGDRPWNRKIADRGFGLYLQQTSGGNYQLYRFAGADGSPTTEPVLMDGQGHALIDGTTNPATTTQAVIYPGQKVSGGTVVGNPVGFRTVPDVDFSGLFNGLSSTGSS